METEKIDSPFILQKLTLRGIGSYLDGAELDIRPLTILCGENGSGKSTWLNTLELLKSAIEKLFDPKAGYFPDKVNFDSLFNICRETKTTTEEKDGKKKRRCAYGTIANTRISMGDEDGPDGDIFLKSVADENLHGPIGTIGFHFSTDSEYHQRDCFSLPGKIRNSPLSVFLKKGFVPKGTKIKLFLTIPDTWENIKGLHQGFQIGIGDESLAYKKIVKRNPDYKGPDETPNLHMWTHEDQLTISCRSYDRKLTSKNNDFSIFSDNVFWRFIISLRDLLHGFFHLGAIRDNFDKDEDNNIDRDEYDPIEKQRYVGPKGEYTHFLINRFCWNLMTSKKDLCLGEYYSIWLKNLLGLGSCYTADSTGEGGDTVKDRTKKSTTPADFLKLYIPDKNATPDRHPIGEDPTDYPTDYSRYGSDVLWGDGLAFGPSCFSSGFHQIAPMIVQSGLMKKYEVCAIENPEVHLHPDLQMKLTEFLLDQAVSKRFFIIETHSDLIIRRLIRAILEEDKPFAQEKICINFTRIEPHSGWRRNLQSKIEPLQVDGQGRIKNWPARFMSESIKESQRLMDIMYRQDTQNEDDDE